MRISLEELTDDQSSIEWATYGWKCCLSESPRLDTLLRAGIAQAEQSEKEARESLQYSKSFPVKYDCF
jgi:hypothetical protein